MTLFGVPKVLILDNTLQFDSKAFWRYCMELGITNRYSTPSYLQGNGQAEATKKAIVNDLKKRLNDSKGWWTKELPSMLWAYRTTPRHFIRETPFLMTYGAEVVIPMEMELLTSRIDMLNMEKND